MTYHLPVPENQAARDILEMIAEVSRNHPRMGWDDTEALVHFQDKAIEMSGSEAGNFVACMESIGLSRFDAVETFVRAKHPAPPDQKKSARIKAEDGRPAQAVPKPAAENSVHPERPGEACPIPASAGTAAAGDPDVRPPPHRPPPPKAKPGRKPRSAEPPQTQDSLF